MMAEHARSIVVLQQLLVHDVNINLVIAKWCEKNKALVSSVVAVNACPKGVGKESIARFLAFIEKLEKNQLYCLEYHQRIIKLPYFRFNNHFKFITVRTTFVG